MGSSAERSRREVASGLTHNPRHPLVFHTRGELLGGEKSERSRREGGEKSERNRREVAAAQTSNRCDPFVFHTKGVLFCGEKSERRRREVGEKSERNRLSTDKQPLPSFGFSLKGVCRFILSPHEARLGPVSSRIKKRNDESYGIVGFTKKACDDVQQSPSQAKTWR